MTKQTTSRKSATKTTRRASTSRAAKTQPKKSATSTARRTTKRPAAQSTNKVDYYPNRMTLAVSVLGGTILVLVAVIAVLGSRG